MKIPSLRKSQNFLISKGWSLGMATPNSAQFFPTNGVSSQIESAGIVQSAKSWQPEGISDGWLLGWDDGIEEGFSDGFSEGWLLGWDDG